MGNPILGYCAVSAPGIIGGLVGANFLSKHLATAAKAKCVALAIKHAKIDFAESCHEAYEFAYGNNMLWSSLVFGVGGGLLTGAIFIGVCYARDAWKKREFEQVKV